jgi:hypothetical protein
MQGIDPAVYELITGSSGTNYYSDWLQPMPHQKIGETPGEVVAEVHLQIGPHTVDVGDAMEVIQETIMTPGEVVFNALTVNKTTIPKPKMHTRVTFKMKNWPEVLRGLGWRTTCGNPANACDNWSHYAPPKS